MNKGVKIRYSPEEFKKIKKEADKLGISMNKYQIKLSKKAKVKIEINKNE